MAERFKFAWLGILHEGKSARDKFQCCRVCMFAKELDVCFAFDGKTPRTLRPETLPLLRQPKLEAGDWGC